MVDLLTAVNSPHSSQSDTCVSAKVSDLTFGLCVILPIDDTVAAISWIIQTCGHGDSKYCSALTWEWNVLLTDSKFNSKSQVLSEVMQLSPGWVQSLFIKSPNYKSRSQSFTLCPFQSCLGISVIVQFCNNPKHTLSTNKTCWRNYFRKKPGAESCTCPDCKPAPVHEPICHLQLCWGEKLYR